MLAHLIQLLTGHTHNPVIGSTKYPLPKSHTKHYVKLTHSMQSDIPHDSHSSVVEFKKYPLPLSQVRHSAKLEH